MPLRIDAIDHGERDDLLGKFLGPEHYDTLVNEDADIYKPNGDLLIRFRKRMIPLEYCKAAYSGLLDAAMPSNNRGQAAGEFDRELIAPQYRNSKVVRHGNGYQPVLQDGTLSKTVYYNQVNSGIVGFMDRSGRFPFCRQTAYTEQHLAKFNRSLAMIKKIDSLYSELCPAEYSRQRAMADKCSPDFIIKGTSYSTVTVNKNYRTGAHRDSGDYAGGIGNLTVLEAGKYLCGYTIFPRYRVAVDVRMSDMIFMDVHEIHGNQELIGKAGQYVRLSLVCYLREKIIECGTVAEELQRAKKARV